MITWTPQALSLFQCRCEERRSGLLALGADPDEVFTDWKIGRASCRERV